MSGGLVLEALESARLGRLARGGGPPTSSIGRVSFATLLERGALRLKPHPPATQKTPGGHPGHHPPKLAGHQELIMENPRKSLPG